MSNDTHLLTEDTIESADTIRMPRPLYKVYRVFISKRTGIGLILAMGFLTLMGTLIQQSTENNRADATAYADWLDSVRPRYQGWTGVLDLLGMFNVFGSWWFKAVNVLLCISILCCIMHRIPLLWKRATRPQLHVTEGFFAHASIHHDVTAPVPAEQSLEHLRTTMRRKGYRVIDDPRGPGLNLYTDKFRWPPFGTIFAHVAFVIILLGVLVTSNTGFSEDNDGAEDGEVERGRPRQPGGDLVGAGDGVVLGEELAEEHLHHGREDEREDRADGDRHGHRDAGVAEHGADRGADQGLGDITDEQPGDGDAQLGAGQHERRAAGDLEGLAGDLVTLAVPRPEPGPVHRHERELLRHEVARGRRDQQHDHQADHEREDRAHRACPSGVRPRVAVPGLQGSSGWRVCMGLSGDWGEGAGAVGERPVGPRGSRCARGRAVGMSYPDAIDGSRDGGGGVIRPRGVNGDPR